MKMSYLTAGLLIVGAATNVNAKDKPLPEGISVISEADAKACKFVDLVSGSDNFMFKKADGAARNALVKALDKAVAKGANSAVLSGTSSANKETTVMMTAYSCPK